MGATGGGATTDRNTTVNDGCNSDLTRILELSKQEELERKRREQLEEEELRKVLELSVLEK